MEEIKPMEPLNKKERRALRREEKEMRKESAINTERRRSVATWGIGIAFAFLFLGGLMWYVASRPPIPEGEIIAQSGIHWHPGLSIYVKGEKQGIPKDIGIGAVHQPVHTHDADGVIHLEFQGLVRKEDIRLGKFFENWGKDMRSFGTNLKMTVNGKENTEYENYIMQDKDKIELRYE